MRRLLLAMLLCLGSTCIQAAEVRFDSFYFFQSEAQLQQKGLDGPRLARYTRQLQSALYKTLKPAKLAPASGWIVVAVRSDGEVAGWLDLAPALHAYYETQIYEALAKVPPVEIARGILVFGMKLAIDTPVFTRSPRPAPAEWSDAQKTLGPDPDIEQLVLSIWPE